MSGKQLSGIGVALCAVTIVTSAALDVGHVLGAGRQQPPSGGPARLDRSKPPAAANPMGEFTVRRLATPVVIDGRSWRAAQPVSAAGVLAAVNGQFALTLEEQDSVEVVRFRTVFTEAGGLPVRLDSDGAAYAFVTQDSRWIVLDPLEVIDVAAWRHYSLSGAFGIAPYVRVRAVSADGRRLFVTRQDCAFDCPALAEEHYEVTLPMSAGGSARLREVQSAPR